MNNKFNKLLICALIAYFGGTKLQALVSQGGNEVILGEDTHFQGGEHALVGEPGPVIFDPSQKDQHLLGTDTASRPPVQHFLGTDTASRPPIKLGTNPDTYTPLWLDTQENLDEIKRDQGPKMTDEEMLEGLAELFKEEPKIAEEPGFDSVEKYLDELVSQIEGLNNELEEILSHKQLNKLSEKYPLIIDAYEIENNESYPDTMHHTMHPGLKKSEDQAPDLGEIKPIENDVHLGND